MQEIFEIVNREADLSMNRIVVMIKDMGMQDQVGNKWVFFGVSHLATFIFGFSFNVIAGWKELL
jgi:hypothetical protein